MNFFKSSISLFSVLTAIICCSCQQHTLPQRGGSVGVRTYSDAVVHLGQVDPQYQAYFRDQDAANYSLADQRKAYLAAAQTARTPVREADYRPADVRKRVSGKAVSKKGRALAKSKARSTSSTAAKKKLAANRKPARRR